jgi:predicted transcriptional regulator
MEGRPIVVQLVMEPIGQLTWADVVRMANGVENVREFVETYATIAINNRIGTTTVAMHAVMEGGVQGVQIAMFTFQWTPPA